MGFTIPSNDVAGVPARQSVWYDTDIAILVAGDNGVGVLTGCAVTAQSSPDMTVAVAAGTIQATSTSAPVTVTAGNATISTADATNPRIDLVTASATGTKTVTAGTAAAVPKPPALPSGHIALAMVDVPANDTTIATGQITDKRVTVVAYVAPGLANVLVSTGDLVYMGAQGTDYVRSLTSDKFTSFYSGSWSEAGDGNDSTYKRIFADSSEYARVDLGTAQPVGFFRIRSELTTYNDMSWVLQSSDDNSNWTTRASHTDDNIDGMHDTGVLALAGGPYTHRYWRQYPNPGRGGYRDMYTFSLFAPASPVALPVGADNTVLRVATNVPAWEDEFDATAPVTLDYDDTPATGSSATAARRDHRHGMPAGGAVADIVDVPTAETDTALVLAPDGAGGVEFRAENGGSGGAVAAFIGAKVKNTAGTSFTGGAEADVPFATEDFDTDGFHDNVTNNNRLTVPAGLGGKYLVVGQIGVGATAGDRFVRVKKNDGGDIAFHRMMDAGAPVGPIVVVVDLAAGDWVGMRLYPGSDTKTLYTDAGLNWFSIVKLDSGHLGQGVGAVAFNSTTQSTTNAVENYLTLNSEDFDTDGFHSTSVNTSRMTIPAGLGGKYLVVGSTWSVTAAAWDFRISKNRTTIYADTHLTSAAGQAAQTTAILDLVAGDYVEMTVNPTGTPAMGHASVREAQSTLSIMRLDSGVANYTGPLWGSGTAFPSGPATNQRYTRTDLGLDFYWDGTRWVTTTLYTMQPSFQEIASSSGWSSSTITRGAMPHPTLDIYIVDFWADTYVATTNDGSNYWTMALNGVTGASLSTVSNAASSLIQETAAVGQVKTAGNAWIQCDITKMSSPGGLTATIAFSYRLIGT